MSDADFNPSSPNAMFARILERLDAQDKAATADRAELKQSFADFKTALTNTDSRVVELERDQWKQRGFVAGIALVVSLAWKFLIGES